LRWIDQDHAGNFIGIHRCKDSDAWPTPRLPHQDIRRRQVRVSKGKVQLARDLFGIARQWTWFRLAGTRTIVRDDSGKLRRATSHSIPPQTTTRPTRLQDYDGPRLPNNQHVQAMPSCIDV
jgi:hypothetical protein